MKKKRKYLSWNEKKIQWPRSGHKIQNSIAKNVLSIIKVQKANTKSSARQHGSLTNVKVVSGA